MTHTPHDLHAEFPNAADTLHKLKLENAHFNKCADAYHDLNREIHRIEAGIDAASDDRIEALKKTRLALLDEISGMITKAQSEYAQ
jgi:uncharacterized protein